VRLTGSSTLISTQEVRTATLALQLWEKADDNRLCLTPLPTSATASLTWPARGKPTS
jgi:hypothetical protein